MTPDERAFVMLCAGEAFVVLGGMVSLPAAFILQFLLPILIFRDLFTPVRNGMMLCLAYGGGLFIVLAAGLSFRHMFLPLLLLSAIVVLAVFTLLLGETRLRRRYGGPV
jgi:hypothetical protein